MATRLSRRTVHRLALAAGIVALAVVIWVDIATGLWQQVVILSGIAAGLLTFLLTALFLDRWVARADHERWLPVTRLALTDILHALADEDRSELTRGVVVPRELTLDDDGDRTGRLVRDVHSERVDLIRALHRWAAFLAASADVQTLMVHVATIAELLDAVRDAAVELERTGSTADRAQVTGLVVQYNEAVAAAVDEVQALLRNEREIVDR